MTEEKDIGGRPRGLPSRCITIDERDDNPGYLVYIGIDIFERLGSPEYVMIEARERNDNLVTAWKIRPAQEHEEGRYKMIVVHNNRPKFPIGKAKHDDLNLDVGKYPALIWRGEIIF